jgi:hypothetical protein
MIALIAFATGWFVIFYVYLGYPFSYPEAIRIDYRV